MTRRPDIPPPHSPFGFALDLGLPVLGYYTARLAGIEPHLALVVGIVASLSRLVWVALRHHRLDEMASFTAAVLVVGLIVSLVSGDARWTLLRESFGTGAAGLAVVVSALIGRPLVLTAVRSTARPERRRLVDRRFTASARFRRSFTVMTVVWGAGLIAESLLRVPLVFLMDPDVTVALSQVLFLTTMALLAGWTAWYSRLTERREAADRRRDPTPGRQRRAPADGHPVYRSTR